MVLLPIRYLPFLMLPYVLLLLLLPQVKAAGNEEDVLYQNIGVTYEGTSEELYYSCTFRNLWTQDRQPTNFPQDDAKWTGLIAWSHNLQLELWKAGSTATRGLEELAEVSKKRK